MSDKKILEFINNRTKNIDWVIVDKNKDRTLLRGDFEKGSIYLTIVPKFLKKEPYWDFIERDLFRKIGEKLYSKEK